LSAAISAPPFKLAFLGPRYWPIWVGAALLYAITWLPLPIIRILGKWMGLLLAKLAKNRVKIAQRNIQLCYPNLTEAEQQALVKLNLEKAGMALFETAMGWWWPDWRVKKHSDIEGLEQVKNLLANKQGVFALALHNMNIEFACRALGLRYPSVAFYRKHNNPLMDYLQYRGRNRSNKYMIHKRNARALIAALNHGELCIYLPDQDYGRSQSIFVPFGPVQETATTTATMMFIRRTESVPILVTSQYTEKGYRIKFYSPMPDLAAKTDEQALTELNAKIAEIIQEQPESYLWMHKRFKTRPNKEDPSLYS
jgi:KDO2-lipid IV(A) lauroyltransferase